MFKHLQKITSVVVSLSILSACAGRTPNPVASSQYGDQKKSCQALQVEIANTDAEIARLAPDADKSGSNIVLGITGFFFLVPWFFMDLSHADETELNALRQRNNNLLSLAADKNCGSMQSR